MKKKILLALLIVVILLGVGGAYAYFARDTFKSEKDIFFSYLSTDMFDNIQDEKLAKYLEKQKENSYVNKGELSVALNGDSITTDESLEVLNNTKISFEGNVDNVKKQLEQTISVDLAQGFNLPIKFKYAENTVGIQSNFLNSKYIAVRNENLKALLQRFDIDVEEIPDKIEFSNNQFTEEELKTIQDKYSKLLYDNLEKELFSKEKLNNQTIITLKITDEKARDLLTKILETIREDELILDKIYGMLEKEQIQQEIDDMLLELKDVEKNEAVTGEVKLYIDSRKMAKLEMAVIEDNETTMVAVLENKDKQITMKMYEGIELLGELCITKETNGNDVSYTINFKVNSEGQIAELEFKAEYKNLSELNNVQENYEISVSYEDEYDGKTNVIINLENLKTFGQNIDIEGLDESNAIILNDASDEEIQNLLLNIFQNFGMM